MTEDETVGWHHRLDARELEQALGDAEGQESLARCGSWGCKQADTTQGLKTDCQTAAHVHYGDTVSRVWGLIVMEKEAGGTTSFKPANWDGEGFRQTGLPFLLDILSFRC